MFEMTTPFPVDPWPTLKGAALRGFREAVANWQHVTRLEAGVHGNRSGLLFADHVVREMARYAGTLSLDEEQVFRAVDRYAGAGAGILKQFDAIEGTYAEKDLSENDVRVLRGARRLKTIFQQAQIVNQGLLPRYIEAVKSDLQTEGAASPSEGSDVVRFIENVHILQQLPERGAMDAFTHVEIEAQAARAMRVFQAVRKDLSERRQIEGFWANVSDMAMMMRLSAHPAFTYQPRYLDDMLPLKRQPLQLVRSY